MKHMYYNLTEMVATLHFKIQVIKLCARAHRHVSPSYFNCSQPHNVFPKDQVVRYWITYSIMVDHHSHFCYWLDRDHNASLQQEQH